jgi:hypothetical protein
MNMKPIKHFNTGILVRIALSIMLAGAALGLFWMSKTKLAKPTEQLPPPDISKTLADIDRDVDTVLAHFKIEKAWARKQNVPIPNSNITRTERRIAIPKSIEPMMMNIALSSMAKRYNGRAIASENLKENTVTIHIEVEGYIIQTIILKPTADLKPTEKKGRQAKV